MFFGLALPFKVETALVQLNFQEVFMLRSWIGSWMVLGAIGSAWASGGGQAAKASSLADQMAYYLKDGGQWRADNPDHVPGDGQPAAFGYHFEWTIPNHLAVVNITGIFESGEEVLYWKVFTAWHPSKNKPVLYQFGNRGHLSHGEVQEEDGHWVHAFSGWYANGQAFQFRDREIRLGPNQFRSETLVKQQGTWQVAQSLVWSRQTVD